MSLIKQRVSLQEYLTQKTCRLLLLFNNLMSKVRYKMMKQKEYSSCKYRVSRIRIPFIFREVNIVTSFDDINEKRSFICEPLNTPHFTPKHREEISMHQQVEFHGSFSSGEIKSHSLWNSYKDSIFLVDHIYVLAAQKTIHCCPS